jgi:hypothetical protein
MSGATASALMPREGLAAVCSFDFGQSTMAVTA